jgi:4-alpha-glucanotransferase
MNKRASGVLLHITSLASPYGIGDLGPCAYQFADFLAKARQRYWQILPVNPTDGINSHSPYSCYSAFAGNTLLISPDLLLKEGWISRKDLRSQPKFVNGSINYPVTIQWKIKILRSAFDHFKRHRLEQAGFNLFCTQHQYWLEDFALFVVLKSHFEGRLWGDWPKAFKMRDPAALRSFARKNRDQILRVKFEQYLFFKQWFALKRYCQERAVGIIGDIPIYVNYDSADVWTHPKLFKLDRSMKPKFVSGVPPDYFSKTGQRWGNPVYDWKRLRKSGYSWWIERIEHNIELFDYVRIDHFRGFASFWQIPACERIAVFGQWVKAPGNHFFSSLLKNFDNLPIIAEDLGYITPDVIKLIKRFKFPGMRVLLFAFDDYARSNPHRPENYSKNCVAYTGTHDNNTVRGWFDKDASWHAKENVSHHFHGPVMVKDVPWLFIKEVMKSEANTAMIPMQDILCLGDEARINRPSTMSNNWQWRMRPNRLKDSLAKKLAALAKASHRDP